MNDEELGRSIREYRFRFFGLPADSVLMAFKKPHQDTYIFRYFNDVPDDAVVHGVHFEFSMNQFVFRLVHSSFESIDTSSFPKVEPADCYQMTVTRPAWISTPANNPA